MDARELTLDRYYLRHGKEICLYWGDMGELFEYGQEDDYDPIPLTEKWLGSFGFEKDNETYSWGILVPLEKCDFMFQIEVFANDPSFYYLSKCHEIKYVHQLQNLYFALTGKELEIKNA